MSDEQQVAARDTTFDGVVPKSVWISTRSSKDRNYIYVILDVNGIEKVIESIYVGNYDGILSSSTQITWVVNQALDQANAEIEEWQDLADERYKENKALTAKLKAAEDEIEELLWTVFSEAHYDAEKDEYDTMALSHIRDAADRLVELGKLECLRAHGRRGFYRKLKPAEAPKE